MAWTRVGDCPPEQCQGRCCESIGTWFDITTETRSFMELLSTRGSAQVLEVEGKYLSRDLRPCQWLTDGLCALHPDMNPVDLPNRPQLCGEFPQEPSQIAIHPECGFRFVQSEQEP